MARRRAASPESAPSDSERAPNTIVLGQRLEPYEPTTKPEASVRRRRLSPRKKDSVTSYANDVGSDEEPQRQPSLKPKIKAPTPSQNRAVRLAPLNNSRTLPPLSASELSKDIKPRRRSPAKLPEPLSSGLSSHKLSSKPQTSRCKQNNGTQEQIATSEDDAVRDVQMPEESVSEDASVEESVWCGSGSGSSDSEDELPSPRKLLKLPQVYPTLKSATSQTPAGAMLDMQTGIEALSLSSEVASDPQQQPPVQTSRNFPDVRPTSSSDRELEEPAVLRFSPPRLYSPKKSHSSGRATTPPPASPSKSRLLSPSKKKPRIPTPPMRSSLDNFWNPTAVNDWNDQHSPEKKVIKSPKKSRYLPNPDSTSPPASPRKPQSPSKRTKEEIAFKKAFADRKHQVAEDFLQELDHTITSGQIGLLASPAGGVRFIWSKTLNSTAGRANWRRDTTKTRKLDGTVETTYKHNASIELAEKVINDEHRLLNVIAHEFCHLANFMISNIKDQPHGRQFKVWGAKCTKAFADRGVEVTTKHSYQIEYKYIWQCENEDCGSEFKRHSKSIDPAKQRCGQCRGTLLQVKPLPRGGKAKGEATGYAAFVKQHYKDVKAGLPTGSTQKEVMEALGRRYRAQKEATKPAADVGHEANVSTNPANEGTDVDSVARKLEFVVLDDD